jgi:hypothetical protein
MSPTKHVLKIHGRKCFATGHVIPDGEELQFDRIHAFALDGVSELDNIAPMCQDRNRQKGTIQWRSNRRRARIPTVSTIAP